MASSGLCWYSTCVHREMRAKHLHKNRQIFKKSCGGWQSGSAGREGTCYMVNLSSPPEPTWKKGTATPCRKLPSDNHLHSMAAGSLTKRGKKETFHVAKQIETLTVQSEDKRYRTSNNWHLSKENKQNRPPNNM